MEDHQPITLLAASNEYAIRQQRTDFRVARQFFLNMYTAEQDMP
jgi:hypothetical protein